MTVYRVMKKPIEVQAMQWTSSSLMGVTKWLDDHGCHYEYFENGTLGLGTLESGDGLDRHRAKLGDWIIKGVVGEFYVCDQKVFNMTYDILGES